MEIRYQEWLPAPDLRGVITAYWAVEGEGRGMPTPQILPDGHVEVVMNLGDGVHLAGAAYRGDQPDRVVVGLLSKAVQMNYRGRVRTFGIRFHAARGAGFFGRSATTLLDTIRPLQQFSAALDHELQEIGRVYSGFDSVAARNALDHTLRGLADQALPMDADIVTIVDRLSVLRAAPSVAQLAKERGLSSRQLQRRFLCAVGLSPKRFMRVTRFARVWQIATMSPLQSWAAIAVDHGYCDQAHLIREFRAFGALPPTRMFTSEWYSKTELARVNGPASGIRTPQPVAAASRRK